MNLNLIYFVYGLAFFTMGLVVWVRIRSVMDNSLARTFRWLVAFGMAHAIHDWIEMFVVMGHTGSAVLFISAFFVALSFAVLLQFGVEIITTKKNMPRMTRLIPAILFVLWFLFYLKTLSYEAGAMLAEMSARYTLGLSGAFLTSYALIRNRKEIVTSSHTSRSFFWAGVLFGFYGVFIVIFHEANFFPASILSHLWFTGLIGMPVQAFRALLIIAIFYFIIRSLDILDVLEKRMLDGRVREMSGDLEASEEKYRSLAETASDAIIMIDEEGTILFTNLSSENIFGYSTAEMLGQQVTMLIPESLRHIHLAAVKRYVETSKGHITQEAVERPGLHKSGKEIPLEISFGKFVKNGKYIFTYIIRDIAELKQAQEEKARMQEQLQQAQKMEAIGTLAGGIAHDFNNILSSIFGYTELASLEIPEGSKAEQDLKEVLKAGHRAKDLVKQILAFSRQSKEERKPVQIGPIVKEVLKLLKSLLPTTIEIRRHLEPDTGTIEADPTRIHQVLMNLCTNASHAMGENGGILEVDLQNVDFGLLNADLKADENRSKIQNQKSKIESLDLEPGPYLRLTVSDTGCGMAPEVMERIFDPYFTTKEKGEGTGLGLSVVHGIVKSYGGGIIVESEPGKGTTFHVYLPVIERAAEPEKEIRESRPTGHERILFIDDEPALVDMGRQILEHLGYHMTTRTSSIEALELFKARPDKFDLVITDMTMPNITGEKLGQELMKIRPNIPVILCSGYSEQITEEKVKKLGIRAFAMKPLVMRDLADTARKVLDQEKER